MKRAKIVGIKDVEYQSKKTGMTVKGRQLNITYEGGEGVTGMEVGTVYVSASSTEYEEVCGLEIDDEIRFITSFMFGRYSNIYIGKVE